MADHKSDRNPDSFTSRYKLVYFECHATVMEAIARETQIKGWLRLKKIELIVSLNPEWRDFSLDWNKPIEPFDESELRPPTTFVPPEDKQMRGFFASLRWDEEWRTFQVRARGTEIPSGGRYAMQTHIGVDLHQRFCYLTAVDASGRKLKQGQVVNEGPALRNWLQQVPGPRQVVVEASGFWPAFVEAVKPEADKLVMVHPLRVKAIANARLKNDKVDSETLAHLSRANLLPEAWMADERTRQMRLLTRLRITLGQQRAKAKNQLQAVLHQEGFLKPVTDLFGKKGRAWLATLKLSVAARIAVDVWLKVVDQFDAAIAEQAAKLAAMAKDDARARWLETVPGIAAYSAMVILAEVGDIERFGTKRALASYAGLTPSVRESAGKRKRGAIGHNGSGTLRWIMLQVAQVAAIHSPAAREWYQRLKKRKPAQVALIALARKLLTAVWALLRHGNCFEDSLFTQQNCGTATSGSRQNLGHFKS